MLNNRLKKASFFVTISGGMLVSGLISCDDKDTDVRVMDNGLTIVADRTGGSTYPNTIEVTMEGVNVQGLSFLGYDKNNRLISISGSEVLCSQDNLLGESTKGLANWDSLLLNKLLSPLLPAPITNEFVGVAKCEEDITLSGLVFNLESVEKIKDIWTILNRDKMIDVPKKDVGIAWAFDEGSLWIEGVTSKKLLEKAQEARNAASDTLMALMQFVIGNMGTGNPAPVDVVKCVLRSDVIFNAIADIIETIQGGKALDIITTIMGFIPGIKAEIEKCLQPNSFFLPDEQSISLSSSEVSEDNFYHFISEIARLVAKANLLEQEAKDVATYGKYIDPQNFQRISDDSIEIKNSYQAMASSKQVSAKFKPNRVGTYYFCAYHEWAGAMDYGNIQSFVVENSLGKIVIKEQTDGKMVCSWELKEKDVKKLIDNGIVSIRAKAKINGKECLSNEVSLVK